jgi:hypothetical protein
VMSESILFQNVRRASWISYARLESIPLGVND